jgi:hypothetical protein
MTISNPYGKTVNLPTFLWWLILVISQTHFCQKANIIFVYYFLSFMPVFKQKMTAVSSSAVSNLVVILLINNCRRIDHRFSRILIYFLKLFMTWILELLKNCHRFQNCSWIFRIFDESSEIHKSLWIFKQIFSPVSTPRINHQIFFKISKKL